MKLDIYLPFANKCYGKVSKCLLTNATWDTCCQPIAARHIEKLTAFITGMISSHKIGRILHVMRQIFVGRFFNCMGSASH